MTLNISILTEALQREEFFIVYQPLFDVQTHLPTAMEALLRWNRPAVGIIPPDSFIHLIEGQALEASILEWMFQSCWETRLQWLEYGHDLAVAVNVSPAMLKQRLIDMVLQHWFDLSKLEIEITERLPVVDLNEAVRVVSILKDLGIQILFDDFCGTMNCKNRFMSLPFTGIKIDRSLMPEPPDYSQVFLSSISSRASTYQLITTAEGIEHPAQVRAAQLAGIHRWQGYFGAKPMTAHETLLWIRSRAYQTIHKEIHQYFGRAIRV